MTIDANKLLPRPTPRIRPILAEAWQKTHGFKASWWGGFLITLLISLGIALILGVSAHAMSWLMIPNLASLLAHNFLELVMWLFTLPLVAGLMMLAVRCVGQLHFKAALVFNYYHWRYMWRLFVASLFFSIIFVIGEFTLVGLITILPHNALFTVLWGMLFAAVAIILLLLSMAYHFCLIRIADQGDHLWQAISNATRAVFSHPFLLMALIIITFMLTILSAITLFIIYIWFLPFFQNIFAILYRELLGIKTSDG